jgi:hypothetical protein
MADTTLTDAELAELMRTLVRECSFDFNRVATKVKMHYSKRDRDNTIQSHERAYLTIDAAACRACFAADFKESDKHQEVSPTLLEPQTYEDVVRLQRHIEEQSRLSHARVFERVSESLGVSPGAGAALAPNDEVVMALQRRAEEKRLQEEVALLKKKEVEEDAALRAERERLRSRFQEGGQDAEGVNPLADLDVDDSIEQGKQALLASLQLQNGIYLLAYMAYCQQATRPRIQPTTTRASTSTTCSTRPSSTRCSATSSGPCTSRPTTRRVSAALAEDLADVLTNST